MSEENKLPETTNPPGKWPLWRAALATLSKAPDFGYGMTRPASYFEQELGCKRETADFGFQMSDLRAELEEEYGYYLGSQTIIEEGSGMRLEVWQIPCRAENGIRVPEGFERKLRRLASRAVHIRVKTLGNESAPLTDAERKKMETSLRIASTRQIILSREKEVAKVIGKHAPKLLE